ncbi:SDR family NAD(P)-dependent oxidoreductase [Pelagibacterales bacterium SAG-MED31]|nr:SDR family NAD(P)-dependent oxidoreductase [Pelagibacterales bacterium SAG-MED31]
MSSKIIWITGGSSGIGFATAKYYLKNNWVVVISSSNNNKLDIAKKKLSNNLNIKNLYVIKCDITNKNEVKKTISFIENQVGQINTALLNAAAYSPNKNQEFDINNYELLIDVNLKGTLYCIDNLKDVMKNRGNTIAIVSSPIGYRGWPTSGAYGMTKAAQLNLSESLFFDFKKIKISIRIINPGFIDTESTRLNSFKMPFLKSADFAAEKIYKGLVSKKRFEIYFPFTIVFFIKILRILPYKMYFYLWKKIGNF